MVKACLSNASSIRAPKAPSLRRMWLTLRDLLVRRTTLPGNCRQRWRNRATDASGRVPSKSERPIAATDSIPNTRTRPAQDLWKDFDKRNVRNELSPLTFSLDTWYLPYHAVYQVDGSVDIRAGRRKICFQ
ncbi:hypothetical protein T07_12686 [Trichinella nelsoni]|uniref:Uncharacterized protein n=1 Tax=Trichinella nelsoni TaxID=6336 RepID=A0A0V0RF41_9BILA|nr:hypothetical protein T07_12686 [Trichinella nelsoni]